MDNIKRAIFIAAGEGNRLRPVTLDVPKPLIKVNGKRIIDTSIDALKENGIREIYIVVGYMKEKFYEIYKDDPDIHILENPFYLQGNNITSMYIARKYLSQAFVVEADILVKDKNIFNTNIEKSGYMSSWMNPVPEWMLKVEKGRIVHCDKEGKGEGYRLWGISMWNKSDGEKLAKEIEEVFEIEKKWGIYWDEIALWKSISKYDLGIREISENAVCEIDTLRELIELDEKYKNYLK